MIERRHRHRRRRGLQRRDRNRHLRVGDREPRPRRARQAAVAEGARGRAARPGATATSARPTRPSSMLGWRARTSFEAGLERTIAWYVGESRLVGVDPAARARPPSRPRRRPGPARAPPRGPRARARRRRCDRDEAAIGLRFADRHALVSTEDEEGIESARASRRRSARLIAPGIDWPVAIAARVAARLGLPHPLEPETAALAVSKVRQRERFDEAGVPQPRWRLVVSAEAEADGALRREAARPAGPGGRVARAGSRTSFVRRSRRALEASRDGAALVEEWVDGPGGDRQRLLGRAAGSARSRSPIASRPSHLPSGSRSRTPGRARSRSRRPSTLPSAAAAALGVREGPTYTQIRMGAGRPARDRAGGAARRRPRRRALRGRARHRPERARARRGVRPHGRAPARASRRRCLRRASWSRREGRLAGDRGRGRGARASRDRRRGHRTDRPAGSSARSASAPIAPASSSHAATRGRTHSPELPTQPEGSIFSSAIPSGAAQLWRTSLPCHFRAPLVAGSDPSVETR